MVRAPGVAVLRRRTRVHQQTETRVAAAWVLARNGRRRDPCGLPQTQARMATDCSDRAPQASSDHTAHTSHRVVQLALSSHWRASEMQPCNTSVSSYSCIPSSFGHPRSRLTTRSAQVVDLRRPIRSCDGIAHRMRMTHDSAGKRPLPLASASRSSGSTILLAKAARTSPR